MDSILSNIARIVSLKLYKNNSIKPAALAESRLARASRRLMTEKAFPTKL